MGTHIHIDVVGPLPQSNGFTGWLTITDRHSSLVVTALLRDQTTQSVITAIQQHWYQDKGNPKRITADRGTNFLSADFKSQAKQFCGAICRYAKAHNQSENGFVERVHRTLKDTILKRSDDGRYGDPKVTDWSVQLAHAVLALNAAPKKHLGGMSPAQIMLGIQPALPYSLVCDEPEMDPETAGRQKRCIDWQSQRGKYWRQLLRRRRGTERPTSQKTWRHALMCMLDEVTRRVWRGLGVDSTEYGLDQSKPCGSNIATEQQKRSLSTAVRQPEGFQTNNRT